MPITNQQVSARLALLNTKNWPLEELSKWFGISFGGDNYKILQQFQTWSEQNMMAAYTEPQTIDRCKFEIFLQTRQWMSKKSAALALAVTEPNLVEILHSATSRNLIAAAESQGVFAGVYTSEFIAGFYKRFNSIRTTTFPNLDVFYVRLHHVIKETLGVTVQPVLCLTSEILGDSHYATSVDIITGEPMSQGFAVFLDTNKPLQLRPDACSALTYIKHEVTLRGCLLGRAPNLTGEQVQQLRDYAGRD